MDYNIKIETFENNIFKTVNYNPFPKQQELHLALTQNKYNIVRKSRGMGCTTTMAIEATTQLSTIENFSIAYVASSYTSGVLFLDKVGDLSNQFNFKTNSFRKSGHKLLFDNGSSLTLIDKPADFRGNRFDWVIFDDCFNNKDIKHIIDMSMYMDSNKTIIATPQNGLDPFKRFYFAAVTQQSIFEPMDYLWYDHPNYSHDIEWVRGDVRIPADNSKMTAVRLLEFGFHRESPTYNRYLKMFGYSEDLSFDNFDSYAHSTY
jgi:hypothetical protein